ncbi:MAG: hypothetical protein ACD_29C00098G0003 [uncultured bacterium]|nr:MAG: hypothetical protein ACD_29C00098G0003 [uncultured bacterium]
MRPELITLTKISETNLFINDLCIRFNDLIKPIFEKYPDLIHNMHVINILFYLKQKNFYDVARKMKK